MNRGDVIAPNWGTVCEPIAALWGIGHKWENKSKYRKSGKYRRRFLLVEMISTPAVGKNGGDRKSENRSLKGEETANRDTIEAGNLT